MIKNWDSSYILFGELWDNDDSNHDDHVMMIKVKKNLLTTKTTS